MAMSIESDIRTIAFWTGVEALLGLVGFVARIRELPIWVYRVVRGTRDRSSILVRYVRRLGSCVRCQQSVLLSQSDVLT